MCRRGGERSQRDTYHKVVNGADAIRALADTRASEAVNVRLAPGLVERDELQRMRNGRIAIKMVVLDLQGVVAHERDGVADEAVEALGVLVEVGDARRAPRRVAVHGVPFAPQLACEAEVAARAAVGRLLVAHEVGLEVDDGVRADGARVIAAVEGVPQHQGGREGYGIKFVQHYVYASFDKNVNSKRWW